MTIVEVGIAIVLRVDPIKILSMPVLNADLAQLLITQRPGNTVYGGYWELPGGKADPGESPESCVTRELSEEVGVSARVIGRLPEVVHTYPHATVRLHPRLCRMTLDSPAPRNLHVADHRWCDLDDLDSYRFPEANAAIIESLRAVLARGIAWPADAVAPGSSLPS